ncbi:MAG TPA: hypothetical protein ENI61_04975, partial [Ignavibacteria bacterium]|nr:hypothetical protein [Ignavibacteria bacterium]
MLKNLIILFILLLSVNCFAIPYNSQDNYKLKYPKYIPIHSSFDISLITSNPYSAAGRLIFYIIPADGISLNTINLNNISENLKLNFTSTIMTNLNVPAYKTIIDLSDTSISSGTYFQILMNFYSDDKLSANLRFYGIYMKADSVLGYLSNNAVTRYESLTNQLLEVPLKFYSPNKNAGKSLLIEKYSIFQIPLNNFSSNNLLVEFWVKLNKQGTEILTVKNKINSTELFKFFTSSFQTLSVTSNYSRQDYLYPVFMSNKSWYHISILFSYKKHETYFYCNGQLISKNRLKDLTSLDNLELEFGDMNQGRAFQIDLLRFIDLHNSIDVSFRNKNYRNFRADSSTVLAQLNFDHLDEVASQIA